MASPIGHSLAGLATGALLAPRGRVPAFALAAGALLANTPDLDLLPSLVVGFDRAGHLHHSLTHTLGFAVALTALCLLLPAGRAMGTGRWAALVFLAVAGHVLVDYFTSDTRPPIGVMPFWPLSDRYVIAPRTVFRGIDKRTLEAVFGAGNWLAAGLELAILGPPALMALAHRGWLGPRAGRSAQDHGRNP